MRAARRLIPFVILFGGIAAGLTFALTPAAYAAREVAVSTPTEAQLVGATADLVAALAAEPTSVHAGEQVTWTATVTNLGPAEARRADVDVVLPPAVSRLTDLVVPDGWTCTTLVSSMSCQTPAFGVDATAVFAVTTTVAADATVPTVDGIAIARSAGEDPNPRDNRGLASVAVTRSADLAVTLTGPDFGHPGDLVTLTASVTNGGPSTATEVVATLSDGSTWNVGDLAVGASATHDFVVELPAVPHVDYRVEVSGAEADPDSANNVAVAHVHVHPHPSGPTASPPATPHPTLPETGSGDTAGLTGLAVAGITAGGVLVLAARRRLADA